MFIFGPWQDSKIGAAAVVATDAVPVEMDVTHLAAVGSHVGVIFVPIQFHAEVFGYDVR